MSSTWVCTGCGMYEIPAAFDRCPSCWKDKPIVPKISAASGPTDINLESNEDPTEVEATEQELESPAAVDETPNTEALSGSETAQESQDDEPTDEPAESASESSQAPESDASAPASVTDVPANVFVAPEPVNESTDTASHDESSSPGMTSNDEQHDS